MDLKCDRFLPVLFPFHNPQQQKKSLYSPLFLLAVIPILLRFGVEDFWEHFNFACNIYCLKDYTRRVIFWKFVLTCNVIN